jgi:hypothetical protein
MIQMTRMMNREILDDGGGVPVPTVIRNAILWKGSTAGVAKVSIILPFLHFEIRSYWTASFWNDPTSCVRTTGLELLALPFWAESVAFQRVHDTPSPRENTPKPTMFCE